MKTATLITLLLLSACSPKKGLQPVEWRSGQSSDHLHALQILEVSASSKIHSSNEIVEIQNQTVQGIKIAGSFIKKIKDQNGNALIVRAVVSSDEKKLQALALQLAEFSNRKEFILSELKTAFPMFRQRPPEKIDVLIVPHRGFYEPVWSVIYVDKHGIPWEAQIGSHLQIRHVNRVGSQFHETLAYVFPKGPKASNLQAITLRNLAATPTLSNELLLVTSQSSSKIAAVDAPLKFATNDDRFDQLQAFYFLNDSLSWFERNLNFKLPFKLEAEVAVGAPEKTNSAFYYQGKVRLGSGDGETYSHIAQDPSIVIHESVHAFVEAVAQLPYEGEGGSLNEAFADFFAASQLDNPNMGEVAYLKGPFRRSLLNDLRGSDKNGGLYHDSGIISGFLWDLRIQLGPEKSRQLALLTLNRLTSSSDFSDFSMQVRDVVNRTLSGQEYCDAIKILEKRGL